MKNSVLIAIATTLISTIGTAYAETVITRMARQTPRALQRLTNSVPAKSTEMPVPPSEFDAAVSSARSGAGSSNRLTKIRAVLNETLKNDDWKQTCDGAAWHLLTFLRHLKHKSFDDWKALRRGNPDGIKGYPEGHSSTTSEMIKEDFREIMEVYDARCLESPRPASLTENEGATGVLLDNNVPYCTVTRVSKYHILTARHCLSRVGQERYNAFAAFLNSPTTTWKMSRMSHGTPRKIASYVRRGDKHFKDPKRRDPWDFDILEVTKGSLSGSTTPFASSDVRKGETIRVLAHNNYVRAYLHIVRGSAPQWQDAMRFDTQNSCRAELFEYRDAEHKEACLIHGCQTAPSGSGAAVLRNGKIVAVHINENGEKGCASALKYVGNRGVRKWSEFEEIRSAILDEGKPHLR